MFERWLKPDVRKLAGRKDVRALLKALRYRNDDNVRRDAAEALGKSGERSAAGPLIDALRTDAFDLVRQAAAYALGNLGDASAFDALVEALSSRDRYIVTAAIRSLKTLADPRGRDAVLRMLRDLPPASQRDALELIAAAAEGYFSTTPIEPLLRKPGFEDPAARAMGKSSQLRMLDVFTDALRSRIFCVQRVAVEQLERRGAHARVEAWASELTPEAAAEEAALLGRVLQQEQSALIDDALLCLGHQLLQNGTAALERAKEITRERNPPDVAGIIQHRWERIGWSAVASHGDDWRLDEELNEIKSREEKGHLLELSGKLRSPDARVGRAAALAYLNVSRNTRERRYDSLRAPLVAFVLRGSDDARSADAMAELLATYPMGTSWGPRHRVCLELVRDREAVLRRLVERLANADPAAPHTYAAALTSAMHLAASPEHAEARWKAIQEGRFSDYDTIDLENRSLQGQKDAELDGQRDFNRRALEAMRAGLESGDKSEPLVARCERIVAALFGGEA